MQHLERGSVGPAVRDLQSRLNQVLKPIPPLAIDGVFGPRTDSAVRAFQARACPPADGIVGPKTRAALNSGKLTGPPGVSLYFTVPAYLHIAQDKTMSCWFASAQMLIQWQRNRAQATLANHPDPSESAKWSKLYSDDTGISNAKIRDFARDMGFDYVPPMSPTPEAILGWLRQYGPLWVNGVRHITVIAGIRGPRENTDVLVLDPANRGESKGSWRSLREWYVLDKHSGRDTSAEVEAVFLRLP